ncbi:unnamed protein product [Peniophora sp. CBMAI 1063]|nr:unnamed protein product [Peniophora sp. CBMAI 1063]
MAEGLNVLNEGEPPGGLTKWEATAWRRLYNRLHAQGYQLRDRYRPGWIPSWTEKGVQFATVLERHLESEFEDAIPNDESHRVMDATRIADGSQVILKILVPSSADKEEDELTANRLLSSEPAASHPHNHCLRMLEEIDLDDFGLQIIVFPLYRPWFDPPLHLVAEVIPFVDQLLEGLSFLHDLNIAHGDIKCLNVLMDPSPLYPRGFNPLKIGRYARPYSLHDPPPECTRLSAKMRYVYIDFGACQIFDSAEARAAVPYKGKGTFVAPEVRVAGSTDVIGNGVTGRMYDPFPYDIWLLAKLFIDLGLYKCIAAMRPLIQAMYADDPASRPTARQCLDGFRAIVPTISWGMLARIPNPMVTIYFTPRSWAEAFMGPRRAADAKEYLHRLIDFLVRTDGVPRLEL